MVRKKPIVILLLIIIISLCFFIFSGKASMLTPQGAVRLVLESTTRATLPKNDSFSQSNFLSKWTQIQNGIENKEQKEYNRKIAYVTFDDGPNEYTQAILETLEEKDAKSTFFWIEPNIKRHLEISKEIVKKGHYPAMHSVTHRKEILYQGNPENFINEMLKTQKTIKEVTGFDSILVRTPYGSKPYLNEARRELLVKSNLKLWDWSVDSNDWKHIKNVENIVNEVKMQVFRDTEVILFHDKEGTATVLQEVIDYLKLQGYSLEAYNPDEHLVQNFWKDERL